MRPFLASALDQILGNDHPDTLRAASNLATTLHALGQHQRACQLAEDTLTRMRRVLGDHHPLTLRSTHLTRSWRDERSRTGC